MGPPKVVLVLGWFFDVIDYQHLHRSLRRLKFQPKLLLKRAIHRRRGVQIVSVSVPVPATLVSQHKIISPRQPRLIDYRPSKLRR